MFKCIEISIVILCLSSIAFGQTDGLIHKGDRILFPLGFYEHPQEIESIQRMANAGINLVHCHSREDLDRASSVGLMGVVPLPLQNGATRDLEEFVRSIQDHPALAVWEGPDEIVWNFTAASMLYKTRGIHKIPGEWWKQTENALDYAHRQAEIIIPQMREAVAMVRKLDLSKRPVWINEAVESDLFYVRQYLPFVDITGCDYYPVKKENRPIHRVGMATDRWMQTGQGRPVWMVLQAFAWSELGEYYGVQETAYPTFFESRFMAYDAIAHGAKGILYWGSAYLKSERFRESIYALTRELAVLQPFLTAPNKQPLSINLVDFPDDGIQERGVKSVHRQWKNDWLLVLINEDDRAHMGVEVKGLDAINAQKLELLYGQEVVVIERGQMVTRLKPYEVKVFASDRRWESPDRSGRDFIE